MTRRVSRNGNAYSQGSHMVRGDFPKNCAGCGEFVPLNECWQETIGGTSLTWHHRCRREAFVCVVDESAGLKDQS